jgi:hypothetical protein
MSAALSGNPAGRWVGKGWEMAGAQTHEYDYAIS